MRSHRGVDILFLAPDMSRSVSIVLLLLACASVQAGLGVFANDVELVKSSAWSHPRGIYYETRDDAFVVDSPLNKLTGLPKLTITGTNLVGDVAIVICGQSAVMIKDLRLRTTTTNQAPILVEDYSEASVFLSGKNRFEAADGAAGIELGNRSILSITNAPGEEAASVVAIGGRYGAGIGTGFACETASALSLCGGIVEAHGGDVNAAGIGQGYDGRIREFNVNGGTVRARSGGGVKDFVSGYAEDLGHQFIRGGSFDVESFGGTPFSANFKEVRQVAIRNEDWLPGDPIPVSIANNADGFTYATNGIFAGRDHAIHLWLPKGIHEITVDDLTFSVSVSSSWQTVDLSGNTFAEWCALRGLEPREDALTDGEPNILRYIFNRPSGPLPMPTLDPSPKYPTVVMPPRKHDHPNSTLLIIGTTDLSRTSNKWYSLFPSKENPDLWIWHESAHPCALFVRYQIIFPDK